MKDAVYTALGLLAGIAVPIMATLNASLGVRMGSPFAAAAVLCLLAFMACVAAYYITGGAPGGLRWPAPNLGYTAGLLFTVYIASITFLAPRIGVGNAIVLVLFGQIVSSAVIDHFGLFGAPRIEITPRRVLGFALMAVGIYLARRPL
ncbi:MAG: DMT family transporter [Pseudomonadota bacterium]